jgi:hypothetical protein
MTAWLRYSTSSRECFSAFPSSTGSRSKKIDRHRAQRANFRRIQAKTKTWLPWSITLCHRLRISQEKPMAALRYGDAKYGSAGLLASSADRGWSGLSAQLRSHGDGVIAWKNMQPDTASGPRSTMHGAPISGMKGTNIWCRGTRSCRVPEAPYVLPPWLFEQAAPARYR